MTLNASIPTIEHALIVVESEIPRRWQDCTWFLFQKCRHRGGMTTHMGLAWVKNRNSPQQKIKQNQNKYKNKCSFTFWFFFFGCCCWHRVSLLCNHGCPETFCVFYGNLRLTEFDLPLPPEDWDKRTILHAWILSQILSFNTVITWW